MTAIEKFFVENVEIVDNYVEKLDSSFWGIIFLVVCKLTSCAAPGAPGIIFCGKYPYISRKIHILFVFKYINNFLLLLDCN